MSNFLSKIYFLEMPENKYINLRKICDANEFYYPNGYDNYIHVKRVNLYIYI